jgi:hypothetical protein
VCSVREASRTAKGTVGWKKDLFLLKENAMLNYNNYLPSEETPRWRSASEITIAALKHEERRIQMMDPDMPLRRAGEGRKTGLLSLLKAPLLRMLATLIG